MAETAKSPKAVRVFTIEKYTLNQQTIAAPCNLLIGVDQRKSAAGFFFT